MILPSLPSLLITLGISLLIVALGLVWMDARRSSAPRATLRDASRELPDNYAWLSSDFYAHVEPTSSSHE